MHDIDLAILLTKELPKCQTLLFSGRTLTADLLAEAEKEGYTFSILAKPVHPSLLLEAAVKARTADKEKQP
ncbi:MAG: hypothetical protein ACJ72H_12225 [Candidatus Sulfotelmatobacter sp.]